jgi:hypothetical protein
MRRVAVVGVAAVLLGIAAVADRALAGLLPLDGLFVTGVGGLAVLAGLWYGRAARSTTRRRATVDPPERRHRSAVLGADVEGTLRTGGRIGTARRVELRRRIRTVAVDALVVRGIHDRRGAERAVDAGRWTDDPVAAGYLAEPEALPRRWWLRRLVRPRSTARRCIARSLAAIEEVGAA